MVGNNDELFDKEQVPEKEAIDFAKEINAIYKLVSSDGRGMDELFQCIGKKFLNQKLNQEELNQKHEDNKKKEIEKGCVLF